MNLLGQAVDASCEVLGHGAALNSLDTHPLQNLGEPADQQKTFRAGMFPSSQGQNAYILNTSLT